MNMMALRRQSVVPPDLVENFEAMLNEKRFQEAYELAKNDESFLGHVLAAGLAKLQEGYPQAVEAMQEVGEDENMRLEQRLSYIALIGTISPMVGLLGTVDGMVAAFQVIASTQYAAQAVGTGRRHLDGPDHDAGRPVAGDSGHRGFRHLPQPAGAAGAGSRHLQRTADEPVPERGSQEDA